MSHEKSEVTTDQATDQSEVERLSHNNWGGEGFLKKEAEQADAEKLIEGLGGNRIKEGANEGFLREEADNAEKAK
ncbi:MAG: hypothetical protein HYT62_02930 [Candidatus Yanofskybacteria bacterium]|nr:hypothetical protein [Candidatus Yanofskybacteria bacterium]